jgi:hypothetical protein
MNRRPILSALLSAGLLVLPASPALAITPDAYQALKADIQAEQVELRVRWKAAPDEAQRASVLDEARAQVHAIIAERLIPAWEGTTWEFYGTTQVPGQGAIACGYYVSTLLEHAGFDVERVELAQQASERIIKSLTDEDHIWRSSDATAEASLAPVREGGKGIYMVGLDYHVGLLVHDGVNIHWCDSSYLNPTAVTCQDPVEAFSYTSRYRVIGQLLTDPMMVAWLEGRSLPTFRGPLR